MGRRKLCGIAAAGGMFLLTGCSGIFGDGTAEPIQSMKIGICTYDQFDTFIGTLVEEFKEEARQKEQETGVTITVEVVGAGGKQNIQNDQVESLINNGCDILLVNQVDRTDTTMVIDKAKNADIPVIFFNRELVREDLERWEKLYYVGVKTLESGVMQGEIVVDLCSGEQGIAPYDKNGDGRLQYVMLEGEAGHQDALIRTELCAAAPNAAEASAAQSPSPGNCQSATTGTTDRQTVSMAVMLKYRPAQANAAAFFKRKKRAYSAFTRNARGSVLISLGMTVYVEK